MDEQLGAMFDLIRDKESLRNNTLVLVCSDNGPEQGAGQAGPFRGYKTWLYEGGIRSSLIIWGPGLVDSKKVGTVNDQSYFSAIDLVPSLLDVCGVETESSNFDGQSLAGTLLGKSLASRTSPLNFRRPPDRDSFYGDEDLPDLAVRDGDWKLLCEYDGSDPELYDLKSDRKETTNVAVEHPKIVERLIGELVAWHRSLPADTGDPQLARPTN